MYYFFTIKDDLVNSNQKSWCGVMNIIFSKHVVYLNTLKKIYIYLISTISVCYLQMNCYKPGEIKHTFPNTSTWPR